MIKGKHTLANGTSHEDPNLEDDYHNLFADNTDLEDKEDEVDLDGIANLDSSEMDGVEFDGSYFNGADLDELIWMVLREIVLIWLLLMLIFLKVVTPGEV